MEEINNIERDDSKEDKKQQSGKQFTVSSDKTISQGINSVGRDNNIFMGTINNHNNTNELSKESYMTILVYTNFKQETLDDYQPHHLLRDAFPPSNKPT